MGANSSKRDAKATITVSKQIKKRADLVRTRYGKKKNYPIVPPGSPADVVLREEGMYSVFPFTYDVYEWTDGCWPINF